MINKTRISVCMITYNHEKFIEEAINSVLMQECSFEIELIISNDCSTDSTNEVVKKVLSTHPRASKIKYINHEINLGMMPNALYSLRECSGNYIALCEGDDYWTDPLKLQKQANLLESNKSLIACHHWQKLAILENNNYVEIPAPTKGQGYYNQPISDVSVILANKMRVKARTVFFRNVIDSSFFPDWMNKVAYGDVPLSFLLGKHGDFGFIDEEMAVYRQTGEGASTAGLSELSETKFRIQMLKNWIVIWDYGNKHFQNRYRKECRETVKKFYRKCVRFRPYNFSSVYNLLHFNIFDRPITSYEKFLGVIVIFKEVIVHGFNKTKKV